MHLREKKETNLNMIRLILENQVFIMVLSLFFYTALSFFVEFIY